MITALIHANVLVLHVQTRLDFHLQNIDDVCIQFRQRKPLSSIRHLGFLSSYKLFYVNLAIFKT